MFKDIKNRMNLKRPCGEDSLNKASIINMLTSEIFPIEKEKEFIFGRSLDSTITIDEKYMSRQHCCIQYVDKLNSYIINDLCSSTGTFLNYKRLPKGKSHIRKLRQEDVISFGYRSKITLSYQFILHSLPAKKYRSDYEQEILEARKEIEKYKKTVSKHQGEIVDMKYELMKLRDTVQTNLAEMQDLVNKVMGITHTLSLKAREIIQQMTSKISVLKSGGNPNEQILFEEIKIEIFAQLKSNFQCSICLDLICKATTISCNHTFCHVCIRTWKNTGNIKCPICRAPSHHRDTNCFALDTFITSFCDFMGGEIQEQRKQALTQKSIVVPLIHNRRRRMSDHNHLTIDDEDVVFVSRGFMERSMARPNPSN